MSDADKPHLSYKFQRLREQLRQAVLSGELTGRLPGERVLAKQFGANPKTLGKALNDLMLEGLLLRSIGRGTFVRDRQAEQPPRGPWLILLPAQRSGCPVAAELRKRNPDTHIMPAQPLRPGVIKQFSAVFDLDPQTPTQMHRDLCLRSLRTVVVDKPPQDLLMPTVILDRQHAAYCLARQLLLDGCRHLVAVDRPGQAVVYQAIHQAAQRYAAAARVTAADVQQLQKHSDGAGMGVIIDGAAEAAALAPQADVLKWKLASIGYAEAPPCMGYFLSPRSMADAACQLLEASSQQPAVLWLLGEYHPGRT
jgi:hypothetical protein